jgi:hypothetical protein
MNEYSSETTKLIEQLQKAFINECGDNAVSVNVFFSCKGVCIEITTRTPKSLKLGGISMRNLRNEFIK